MALGGCGVLAPPVGPQVFLTFDDQNAAPPPTRPPALPHILLIAGGPSPVLYSGERMVYTRDGVHHAYYQQAHWSERPLRRMSHLAERRLSTHTGLQAVGQSASGLRGTVLLTLRLDGLFHDDARTPGRMQLDTTAELIDWPRHTLMARRRFELSTPVAQRDAAGAAYATSALMTQWLNMLTVWVQDTLSAPASHAAPKSDAMAASFGGDSDAAMQTAPHPATKASLHD
jgi:ABC-type uncharacterized transport system auxiliary subunit